MLPRVWTRLRCFRAARARRLLVKLAMAERLHRNQADLTSRPQGGIRAGVIGTETGIQRFERWVQRPVFTATALQGRPPVSRL
jgi:hypothetical protein